MTPKPQNPVADIIIAKKINAERDLQLYAFKSNCNKLDDKIIRHPDLTKMEIVL